MKNYISKYLFLLFTTCVLSKSYAGILSELDLIKLDSLILQKNSEELSIFFDQKDDDILSLGCYEKDECENYSFIKQRYTNLLEYVSILDTLKEKKLDKYLISYEKLEYQFTIENAGEMSHKYYGMFMNKKDAGHKKKSFVFYNLSYNRKVMYKKKKTVYFNKKIVEVENFIKKGDYSKAEVVIEYLLVDIKNNTIDKQIKNKIDLLNREIEEKLKNLSIQNKLNNQTKILRKKNSIGVGVQTHLFISKIDDVMKWEYFYSLNEKVYDFKVKDIKYSSSFGYNIEYNRFVSKKLNIGLNLGFEKLNLHFTNFSTNLGSNFDCKNYSIAASCNYYHKNTIGLRPYIGLGLKYNKVLKEKFIFNKGYSMYSRTYILREEEYLSQMLINSGLEYIGPGSKNLMFKFQFQLICNNTDSNLIGALSGIASLNACYLF